MEQEGRGMKIGDLKPYKWTEGKNGKRINHYGFEPDCENCPMGWDVFSYEGECQDCGCYFNYDFDVPLWKCALPHWIKKIILKKLRK